jgi:hypothetical protein
MVKEVGDVQEPPSFALKLEKPRTAPSKAASIKGSAPKVPERQAAPSSAAAQVEVPAAEPPQPAQQHSAEAAAAPPSEVQTRGAQPQDSGPQAAAEGADKGKAPAKAGCAAAEASAPLAAEQVLLHLVQLGVCSLLPGPHPHCSLARPISKVRETSADAACGGSRRHQSPRMTWRSWNTACISWGAQ